MTDQADWLLNRLTPVKQKEQIWADFAKILEQYWSENFDPVYDRLEKSRSIYTSDDETLTLRLSEIGEFYPVDSLLKSNDRILTLAWRNLALYYKDAKYLIDLTVLRKFGPYDISWEELYHDKQKPYGTEFISKAKILDDGKDISNFFLTSHGVIEANYSAIKASGVPTNVFVEQVGNEIEVVRPAHIVFDGIRIYDENFLELHHASYIRESEFSIIPPAFLNLFFKNTILIHGASQMIISEFTVMNPRACLIAEDSTPEYEVANLEQKKYGFIASDETVLVAYDMPYIILKGDLYGVQ